MTYKLSAIITIFTLCAGALLLSACGFTLKGRQAYAFQRLYIAPAGQTSAAMIARLKRTIRASSQTVIVNDPHASDATLLITQSRTQNILSINGFGIVEEFELILSVNYSLVGADQSILIPPSLLQLNRSMTYNDQFALAKAAESNLLYRDMENDAADQLLRRLAAVRMVDTTHTQKAQKSVPAIRLRAPLPTPPL